MTLRTPVLAARVAALSAVSALALALAAPASAAVAVGGEMNAVADAYADGHPTVTSTDQQSWSGVPATLNTSVHAHAFGGVFHDHNDVVDSFGDAQGTWSSANAGSVQFTNYGWNFNTLNPNQPNGADLDALRPGDGADWSYTFTATGNGVITMGYDVTATGNPFGLFGWAIGFTGVGAGGPDLNQHFNDPTTSGTFVGQLVAGQTYTIGLYGNPNVAQFGVAQFAGAMDGQFDWRIDERGVPEPAAWALMLTGFAGAGAALRRRRALAAA